MNTIINLEPVEMTPSVMKKLEDKGLIIRLCPNNHELPAKVGETLVESLYISNVEFGSHKLIIVTVNQSSFNSFGSHPDNEEFLLIGDPATKPLYLIIALCKKEELYHKIAKKRLFPEDFICLHVKYNDPQVSFFTILANVPHGEAVADVDGRPASFYVTEPCDLGIDITKFAEYKLSV